ncbi:MAG: WecB/TagA/CpsF family glycosyltransferase [Propionibacteriaceae bacterium]|nr:WecB/TagA/CpsF family glycosyltransferase [Propionibacteriaceae bacterium]
MKKVRLLNGRFDHVTLEQSIDAIDRDTAAGVRGWAVTINVSILMMMRSDPELASFMHRARWTLADGQPLVWLSRALERELPERVTGVDLIDPLCERAIATGRKIYFLGATPDVIETLEARIRRDHPALECAFDDGYFSNVEAVDRAQAIADFGTDWLIVGMGVPRQEHFIEHHWDQFNVSMAVGVGGSFDVLAGLRKRAPLWMQRVGLEWLFRLLQEPRRLFLRYLVTNTQFMVLAARALFRRARARARKD